MVARGLPGGEAVPEAYHVTAREILEIADRMIFLWDGQPPRGIGGTGESVREARERGISSRIIHAATLEVSWNGIEPVLNPRDPDFDDLPACSGIQNLFDRLDNRATAGAPRSRYFTAGSMSLNQLATILPAVMATFFALLAPFGPLLKLLIVIAATLLPWIGNRLRWQERWVRDRVRVELLRSLLASHAPGSPLRPPGIELFGREAPFSAPQRCTS